MASDPWNEVYMVYVPCGVPFIWGVKVLHNSIYIITHGWIKGQSRDKYQWIEGYNWNISWESYDLWIKIWSEGATYNAMSLVLHTKQMNVSTQFLDYNALVICTYNPTNRLEPIMLKNLSIIPSWDCHNFYLLFLFYSHSTSNYSF